MDNQKIFSTDPTPLYYANLEAKAKVVINQGGTSSGKSFSIMQLLFTIAMARKNYVITVVSNSVPKLKEDTMRISGEIYASSAAVRASVSDYNKTERTYTFKNGSLIEFKSFETAEQAKGGKRHILYINEATRVDYMIFFEAQLRTYVRTYIDYNPTARFWVHDRVINNKIEYPSVKVIRSWHIHNPYLSDEMRERIESIQDPELWKVYARGLTGKLTGTVYSWDQVEQFPTIGVREVIWGLDLGYTNDPTALVKVAVMESGDYDFVIDECSYQPGIVSGHLHQILTSNGHKDGQVVYCEHDKEYVTQLRMMEVSAVMAEKGEGSVNNGIMYLKSKRIAYTRRSVNMKIELDRYRFQEVDGQPTNKPVDAWNHLCDAVRYAIYTYRRNLTE